jgi:3-isopropylmalate/(R)-2-methylmalate dehydratase large subunit
VSPGPGLWGRRLGSVAQTLAEKILARAAGRTEVSPGEIVTCAVDLAMIHDSGGPRRVKPILERLGVGVWDPDRVVLVSDHFVPAVDAESAAILDLTRSWACEQGIEHFHDMQGICHVVLPEHGHLRPGMFVVGGDSHTTTGGAFGAYAFGVGATEMAAVLATGEIWLKVPETILVGLRGRLAVGVSAKDVMLHLCATLGMAGGRYSALEYAGDGVEALSMHERMTLCNMAAELGAQAGLVAPDGATAAYLESVGVDGSDAGRWHGDPDADVAQRHDVDTEALEPQVAAPLSPANAGPVSDAVGTRIDQAYVGACTGAKLEDLRMAAAVLAGRTVSRGVRLLVAPASTRTTRQAAAEGTLATLLDAGAILLPSGCGACAGLGAGVLAAEEVCIATTARNFRGRMGSHASRVYLASPYTVAASAVAGRIADPRDLLAGAA